MIKQHEREIHEGSHYNKGEIVSKGEVVREYTPLDEQQIHGLTYDGKLVWFARDNELVAFDPVKSQVDRRYDVPGADAGTAFDGEHIYQLANGEILVIRPADGQIVRRMPAPNKGQDSGMAWSDGYLWIGQCNQGKIHKVDAKTGEVLKILHSDRFVTGVSCIGGALWHGAAYDDKPSELRRLAADGSVEEIISVPVKGISGIEGTKEGTFWCAGEQGKVRLIRRQAQAQA